MNQGEGEKSYARNSSIQSAAQKWMNPVVEEAVTDLMKKFSNASGSMVIADLGCGSGPNAIALASMAVDAIFRHRGHDEQVPPELCVLLNDLPDNDFSSVAKHLVAFQEDAPSFGPVLTAIVPGSFYKRLFIGSSLHLVLASYSVHWLSEAPEDLRKNRIPMYDCDEGLRQARRPLVLEAYARQFKKDFTLFLNLRAQELVPGGQMVISLLGHCSSDSTCQSNLLCDGVAFMLDDMASKGIIDREKLDSFYLPMYGPSDKELRKIIQDENSFMINKIVVHDVVSDMDKKSSITPKTVALATRAAYGPIVAQHFGSQGQVLEEFERTVELHVSAGSPKAVAPGFLILCVSLKKKV